MYDGQLGNGMWDIMWDISSGKQANGQRYSLMELLMQIPTDFLFKII
jgi:hypothetical protein